MDDTLRTDLVELLNEVSNDNLRNRLELLLYGTKFGYTKMRNYHERCLKFRYACPWWFGFDWVVSELVDNVLNVEEKVHQQNKTAKKHIFGEMHWMMNGIDEARDIIVEATKVGTQMDYCIPITQSRLSS